jgi:hypothetical protein
MSLLLKHPVGQRCVGVDALVDGHTQAAQHDSDQATGAGTADHVEVVARLGRGTRIDCLHQATEDHERGQASHPAAVEGEQAECARRHVCLLLDATGVRRLTG